MMKHDLDQDGRNDEAGQQLSEVTMSADTLQKFSIVKSRRSALALMGHYCRICPAVLADFSESAATLEHMKSLEQLQIVDRIRADLHGEDLLTECSTRAE